MCVYIDMSMYRFMRNMYCKGVRGLIIKRSKPYVRCGFASAFFFSSNQPAYNLYRIPESIVSSIFLKVGARRMQLPCSRRISPIAKHRKATAMCPDQDLFPVFIFQLGACPRHVKSTTSGDAIGPQVYKACTSWVWYFLRIT